MCRRSCFFRPSQVKHITSRENPFYKRLARLVQSSRERRKSGLTVLDGVHLVEAYREAVGLPRAVAVSESGAGSPEIRALLTRLATLQAVLMPDALFKDVSPVATPAGIVALIETPRPAQAPADLDFCLLLEGIQDPGNLGSILRSAAAAGARHVFLSSQCAFAWSPKAVRAGMGAHFALHIHEHADLEELIFGFHGKVVAARPTAARSLFETDLTGNVALLIGSEGSGLSDRLLELASEQVAIPMPGGTESLNAAAAAAVLLFERVRQRGLKVCGRNTDRRVTRSST